MGPRPPLPRSIQTIDNVRTAAFAACFAVIGLHLLDRGYGMGAWIAAALHFIAWPQVARQFTARAADPRRIEAALITLDAFMLGVWIPALAFPTWIAFPLVFAPALNGMGYRGPAGFVRGLVASLGGILAGSLLYGHAYWPATSPLVTTLCALGSLAYIAGVGYIGFRQARHLAEARATLRDSERRYRLIAEHAAGLVALLDRNGRFLYASPSYAKIFRPEDMEIGADAFRNLHEDDQFRVRGALQVVVRSGESCRLRMRLHTTAGEVRRFEALVHPVRDEEGGEEGAITGAVFASRDVTELRDREEQLEIAAHAFEGMAEGMAITNGAGRILMVNQSYVRITGYAAEAVLGRQETEFRTALQPEGFYDEMYAEVLRHGRWEGTTWCRRRDGTLYREWRSVSAVRDPEGRVTHFVALFRELDSHGADARPAKLA